MATYTGSDKRLSYLFEHGGGGGGASALADLTDVDLNNVENGQVLEWDSISQKWINADENGLSNAPFSIEVISRENPTVTLAYNTTNTIKTMTIAKAGYYALMFSDTYNRNNNRSYFMINGTAGEVVIYNAQGGNANAYTDVQYDGQGYSTFSRLVIIQTLKDNVEIKLQMWGNGYNPNSVWISLYRFRGSSVNYVYNYSTDEHEVGCFVDGKPLYQKTIYSSGGNLTNGQIGIPNDLENIEHIVSWECVTHDITHNRDYCLDHNRRDIAEEVKFQIYIPSDHKVYMSILLTGTTFMTAIGDTWVTLQYTKTTDTAGSGKWTPCGTAHHYSETEQVVGTWIDGKTLYEKTKVIPFSSFTALQSGSRYIYTYLETGENVKHIEGYADSASYGHCMLGVRNYEANNTTSNYYWELDNYYNTLNLNFVGNSASVINPTYVYITYRYTKTS